MNKRLLPLLASIAFSACAADTSEHREPVVRDSAGVRITEHPASFSVDRWRTAVAPSLSVGEADGDSFLDRVRGAHRRRDGAVVVANHGTRQLRYFDREGAFVRNASRRGEGPGELSFISWMVTCGTDSAYVWDSQLARLSVFDPGGEFIRSVNLRMPDGSPPWGRATCNDGMFLMQHRSALPPAEGAYRQQVGLVIFNRDGEFIHDLGEFPGSERYFVANSDGTGGTIMDRPMGMSTVHAVGRERVYVGTADNYELRVLSLQGATQQVIRWERENSAITRAHVERYVGDILERVTDPERRRRSERFWADVEFPEVFPAYSRLILDPAGNAWVRDFVKPGDSVQVWNVFAVTAQQVARIELPPGLTVYEIGEDYVLGVVRDELDVEYVQLYDLIKPER